MPIKIGFDISQTGHQKTGCGYFAASTIEHLAKIDMQNTYLLYPTFGDAFWDPEWAAKTIRIPRTNFKTESGHKSFREAIDFWRMPPPDWEKRIGNPDVIHANNFFCPKPRQAKLVYTFYDFNFLYHPEWVDPQTWTACFDGSFNASLHADMIISISEVSRRHFLEIFPHYPADRINVIYPAARFQLETGFKQPESLSALQSGRFWLNVGTLEPKKNQLRLIRAYARLEADPDFPLILAGRDGGDLQDIKKLIRDLFLEKCVILLNYASDAELQWLYQNCFAFVFPSLFEGFGMPLLEAMSLGAPVISSTSSCIPEITGEAALLVDASKEDEITEAMMQLALGKVKRDILRDKGFKRAGQFSWEKAARETLALYSSITS